MALIKYNNIKEATMYMYKHNTWPVLVHDPCALKQAKHSKSIKNELAGKMTGSITG